MTNIYKKGRWITGGTFFTFLLLILTTSCGDDLNELPSQSIVDGNLVINQQSAENALNGVYYEYAMCGTDDDGIQSTNCTRDYEVYPAQMAGAVTYYMGAYYYQVHGVRNYSGSIALWQKLYGQLNAANCAISEITKADDSWFSNGRKEEMLGEAYGLRALILYNLMSRFAYFWDINSPYGLILRTEPSVTTNLAQPRRTVKESYDQILSDVDYAIAHAPRNNDNTSITQWFAKGLKARVLMMRGQGNDYADAGSLAREVIEQGPFQLEDNVIDVFQTKGLQSQEVIFGIVPKENQGGVRCNYMNVQQNSSLWIPTENLISLFENDPRFNKLIDEKTTTTYRLGPNWTLIIEVVTSYTVCKHSGPGNTQKSTVEESQYQMRLTEMYLLLAESMARTGNLQGAKDLLKTVLQHAGYKDFAMVDNATTEHDVLQQLFNETLRNLFCESGRELDIMMRYPSDIVTAFNPEYEKTQFSVCAIPQSEFDHNSALSKTDQNPGYEVQ